MEFVKIIVIVDIVTAIIDIVAIIMGIMQIITKIMFGVSIGVAVLAPYCMKQIVTFKASKKFIAFKDIMAVAIMYIKKKFNLPD